MDPVKPVTREEYQKRIRIVNDYILDHLDGDLSVNTLASVSNFSAFHFHRIASAFLGEPVGNYITRKRIEKAARLLRETNLQISEIAYSVGYDVPSSLTKIFQQFYDVSPIVYRTSKTIINMKMKEITPEINLKFKKIVDLPSKQALFITIMGEYGNSSYGDAWSRLWGQVKDQKLFGKGIEHLGISYDDPKTTQPDKIRYDACLVISKPAKPTDGIGVKEIEGGKFAMFLYTGPYDQFGPAYDAIFAKWLPESGYILREAPCIEKYVSNPKITPAEKLKTEIYLPVSDL